MVPKQSDYLRTLLFISYLLHPKYPPYYFLTYLYCVCIQLKKHKFRYNVICCPNEFIEYLTKHSTLLIDENNCVLTSQKVADNVIDNSLGYVKLSSKNGARIIQAKPVNFELSNDVLIPECLFYNVSHAHKVRLDCWGHKLVRKATEVELALINTSACVNTSASQIDAALKRYFETPRILYKNDLFVVNVERYAPEYKLRYNDIPSTLHFRCKRISSETVEDSANGLLCVLGETTIRQCANVRGYLALSLFQFCFCANDFGVVSHSSYEQFLINKCPYGLEQVLESIEYAVQPFLYKSKLNACSPAFLVQGRKGVGKVLLIEVLAAKLGIHVYKVDCADIQSNTHAQTESKLRNVFLKSKLIAPCFLLLNNFEVFGRDNEGVYDPRLINYFQSELSALFDDNNFPILLICVSNTSNSGDLSASLSRQFLGTFQINAPNEVDRTNILKWLVRSEHFGLEDGFDLHDVGARTHGLVLGDLEALVRQAATNWYLACGGTRQECSCRVRLRSTDFWAALDAMQKSYTSNLGVPKVPVVLWSDVGGHEALKREIIRTINLPVRHPKLLLHMNGLKRSGILLFGPPGTGKTLIAKAVATECGLCFLSVKGPELLNMYVGQSEQNVRNVFERARDASPCIIFFDELDSLAPNRGISGDSGGVMDRVVSQLLAEMDGLNDSDGRTVFVIGATNRPDLIDPALLRPGRFDKLLYVGPCTDNSTKVSVLKALTRKFILSPDVALDKVATLIPSHVTGADLYSICADAWFRAVRRTIKQYQNEPNMETIHSTSNGICVCLKDFSAAVKKWKPSVTDKDMKYYMSLTENK